MQTYSAQEPPPPPEEREFPMEVRHKKAASVVIYEVRNREKAMYTIAYPFDGRGRRQMRREFDTAFSLAKEIALKMADGALNVLTLEGREHFVYERALELSTSVQMDLDVLVSRAIDAANIAGGPDHLIEAARLYEVQRQGIVHKMVPDVVAELIENRRASQASALYLRDLRVRLENRFAAAFKVPISSVTTGDIQRFLDGLKCKPRTKENFLTIIGTLFTFAKNRVRRIVPMSDNLCRWLLPYRRTTGPVYTFSNLALQFDKLAKAVSIPWRKNGLRHSFISYRVAKTQSEEKVALEAGNSVSVIKSNCLHMVTAAQGRRWFSIKPPTGQKIIPIARADPTAQVR